MFAGEAAQARDATYFLNASGGSATATIGGGWASVQTAPGTEGICHIACGSWAVNPYTPQLQGPALDLDLSDHHHILATFPQVDSGINVNVVLYTSEPLAQPGAVHHTSAAANLAPASPGGSVLATSRSTTRVRQLQRPPRRRDLSRGVVRRPGWTAATGGRT